MKSGFALLACAGVLALGLPTLSLAQKTLSLGGSGPADFPIPLDGAVSKVPAIDPATVQGLPSAHDYRPPRGLASRPPTS